MVSHRVVGAETAMNSLGEAVFELAGFSQP